MIRGLLLVSEFFFLSLGVYLPLATVDEFWIISSEFSILSLTEKLFMESEWVLASIVFIFGVVFPLFKIITRIFKVKTLEKYSLHRFSMVDIFLLSFLVFTGKLSKFYEVELLIGFYCLTLSIILGYIQIIFFSETQKN